MFPNHKLIYEMTKMGFLFNLKQVKIAILWNIIAIKKSYVFVYIFTYNLFLIA